MPKKRKLSKKEIAKLEKEELADDLRSIKEAEKAHKEGKLIPFDKLLEGMGLTRKDIR